MGLNVFPAVVPFLFRTRPYICAASLTINTCSDHHLSDYVRSFSPKHEYFRHLFFFLFFVLSGFERISYALSLASEIKRTRKKKSDETLEKQFHRPPSREYEKRNNRFLLRGVRQFAFGRNIVLQSHSLEAGQTLRASELLHKKRSRRQYTSESLVGVYLPHEERLGSPRKTAECCRIW